MKPYIKWKYLNSKFIHNLMYLYDSWDEFDGKYVIYLDGEYWHIEIVTNYISEQLNNSNMENPFPIYPRNPFNRKPFTVKSISKIKQSIIKLGIQIQVGLKILLNIPNNELGKIYDEAIISNGFSDILLDILDDRLKYRIDHIKNSQNLFTGYWITKTTPTNIFDELYELWRSMPYQTLNRGVIGENKYKNNIKRILDTKFDVFQRIYILESLE